MQQNMETMSEYAGRAAGATLGAGLGYLACSNKNDLDKAACIVAGAAAGWAIGDLIDQRRQALEQVSQQENLALVYEEIDTLEGESAGLSTTITDQAMFATGSSTLAPSAREKLLKIAQAYLQQPQKILVIGHTDATGSSEFNQRLSEQRARTVARLFMQEGIPETSLYFQGVGESRPIADNTSVSGQATNRRVEIVEITSEDELMAYTMRKQLSLDNIRSSVQTRTESSPSVASSSTSKQPRDTAKTTAPSTSKSSESTTVTPPAVTTPRHTMALGGAPVSEADLALYQSLFDTSSTWKRLLPVGQAQANNSQQACYQDNFRQSGSVKRLGDDQSVAYSAEDYLPGLNQSLLVTTLEDRLIGLGPVAVTRHFEPVSAPQLYVYQPGDNQHSQYRLPVSVNVYEGDEAWLYRAFVDDDQAPVDCFDLVFNKQDATHANDGRLFYAGNQGLMAVNYTPARPTRQ
ncbi:OmpA family protein [Modicisalibacter luteus]|uniref:OmpA family protein n=1 Tax=Modicisalibacter luteus TaxID=453962 RepID=A0ABV7M631_9GAMM|nr:OmpA family protein [Halomonas lutea]GHA99431.1 hypothetical protein GCM10007159_21520 [Halomonas lutea]